MAFLEDCDTDSEIALGGYLLPDTLCSILVTKEVLQSSIKSDYVFEAVYLCNMIATTSTGTMVGGYRAS